VQYKIERVLLMAKSKVIVRINGAEYTLIGEDSEDYLFSIANYVDKKVKETLVGNTRHSTTSAAVLTSLTLADELFRARREIEIFRKSSSEPEERLKQLKTEYEMLQLTNRELNKENEELAVSHQAKDDDIESLKAQYNELYNNFIKKDEEYEALLKENVFLKEQNSGLEKNTKENAEQVQKLKDQLLECEIELVKVNKDYKALKETNFKKRNG
jgi:cell division protein ZapA